MVKFKGRSHPSLSFTQYSATVQQEMQRLHQVTVYARWSLVGLCWLVIAPLSLWGLRAEIELWLEYFTWAAVRYGLAYNRIPTIGLALCIGMTVTVLVWQSRNILLGISQRQTRRLEKYLAQIHRQGPSHPLWKWVCKP